MSWLRSFVYRHCRKPAALWEDDQRPASPISTVLVLSRHPNPTFTYYLEERLTALRALPFLVRDIGESLEDIDPSGVFIIICRYIKPHQLNWIARHRRQMAGVAYLVDDDVAAVIAGPEARWDYKWKLVRIALMPLRRLNPLLSEVWASTGPLAAALASRISTVTVLPPYPPAAYASTVSINPPFLRMVYHATDIHRREHAFLIPIVEAAMRRHESLRFEVIANGKVARHWRASAIDKARISIRRSMPWSVYVETSQQQKVDIALVPLLDDRVNRVRSDTKRIDIVRMGAAAIFSDCTVYRRCSMPDEIHIGNSENDWNRAIDLLVESPEIRDAARMAARKSIDRMRDFASLQFPALCFETAAVRKSL